MKKIILILSFLMLFFLFTIEFSLNVQPKKYSIQGGKDILINFQVKGLSSLFAAGSNWDGVRDVAKLTKDIVNGINNVLTQLSASGALKLTTSFTSTSNGYTYRYTPNGNFSVTTTALGTKTYTNAFEIWYGTGSTANKAMELYFDDGTDTSIGDGVAAIWKPLYFDSTLNSAGKLMECTMAGGSLNGTMICSWNGPIEASGTVQAARVKVTANSSANTLSYKGLATPVSTTSCSGGNSDYYVLAFITKNVSPYYSTARMGFNDNTVASTICGSTNSYNDAYFNTNSNPNATDGTKYFVADGITSDTNSYNTNGTTYPTIASVSSLFDEINNSDSDLTITKLNSFTVAFRSTSAP